MIPVIAKVSIAVGAAALGILAYKKGLFGKHPDAASSDGVMVQAARAANGWTDDQTSQAIANAAGAAGGAATTGAARLQPKRIISGSRVASLLGLNKTATDVSAAVVPR